jgi:hypothetical protein
LLLVDISGGGFAKPRRFDLVGPDGGMSLERF